MPRGSAYVEETWDRSKEPGANSLQKQVRALFEGLSFEPERVLAGNFVPIRSPIWERLENPEFSLRFGEAIWGDILLRVKPRLVIGMGQQVLGPLVRILGAVDVQSIPVGWGNVSAKKATIPWGSLVVLPHLSRFGIFTRENSADALQTLFGNRWQAR